MKLWQPIVLYVAVLLGLYGTRNVETVMERTQTVARYGTSPKSN